MTTATQHAVIETEVERVLAGALPLIDLREVQVVGSGDSALLRLVIDHPEGVDHDLCAAATRALSAAGLRDRFGIEVSSPGLEPPLRTDGHFRAAVGLRVELRVDDEGRRARRVRGTLLEVEDGRIRVDAPEGDAWIPTSTVRRARIVERSEP